MEQMNDSDSLCHACLLITAQLEGEPSRWSKPQNPCVKLHKKSVQCSHRKSVSPLLHRSPYNIWILLRQPDVHQNISHRRTYLNIQYKTEVKLQSLCYCFNLITKGFLFFSNRKIWLRKTGLTRNQRSSFFRILLLKWPV